MLVNVADMRFAIGAHTHVEIVWRCEDRTHWSDPYSPYSHGWTRGIRDVYTYLPNWYILPI